MNNHSNNLLSNPTYHCCGDYQGSDCPQGNKQTSLSDPYACRFGSFVQPFFYPFHLFAG